MHGTSNLNDVANLVGLLAHFGTIAGLMIGVGIVAIKKLLF